MKKIFIICAFIMGFISTSSAQSAYIGSSWIEHNVYNSGYNCMCVHLELTVDDLKGYSVNATAYVFDCYGNKIMAPYGASAVFRASDGQLSSGVTCYVKYESTYWEDIRLYIPYSLLYAGSYQCAIQVATTSGLQLAYSDPEYFTVGR